MITDSWLFNLTSGILLAFIATAALAEAKSSALVSKALIVWPALEIFYGALNVILGIKAGGFSVMMILGIVLILCGLQAAAVNVRRLRPWPSGIVWLGLALAGIGFQFHPLFAERVLGFLWAAVGITKVARERSASLEAGTPIWILLLYAQAILLAAYR